MGYTYAVHRRLDRGSQTWNSCCRRFTHNIAFLHK